MKTLIIAAFGCLAAIVLLAILGIAINRAASQSAPPPPPPPVAAPAPVNPETQAEAMEPNISIMIVIAEAPNTVHDVIFVAIDGEVLVATRDQVDGSPLALALFKRLIALHKYHFIDATPKAPAAVTCT